MASDDDGRWACPHCSRSNGFLARWSTAADAKDGPVARRRSDVVQSEVAAFPRAIYLGGWKALSYSIEGQLSFSDVGISFAGRDGRALIVATAAVGSLQVTSEQVAKSKVGAVLAFGVLGGLAAKGARNEATVVVRTQGQEAETGYYTIQDVSAAEVKAKVEPWLRARGIPWYEDRQRDALDGFSASATTPPPLSVADELHKLAGLRQSGVLTDEEFATLKARLINGWA